MQLKADVVNIQLKNSNKTIFGANPNQIDLGNVDLPINIIGSEVGLIGHTIKDSTNGILIDGNLIVTENKLADATVGKAKGVKATTNPNFESLQVPFVDEDGIFTSIDASGYYGLGLGLSVSVEKTEQDWNINNSGYTTVLETYARRAINDEEGNKIHTTYTKNTDEISTDRLVLGDQELILFGGDAGAKPEESE